MVVEDLVFIELPCGLPEMVHPADARHPIRLRLRGGDKFLIGGESRKTMPLPDGVDPLAHLGVHVGAKAKIGEQKQKCEQ
jgi:hypothetical protein